MDTVEFIATMTIFTLFGLALILMHFEDLLTRLSAAATLLWVEAASAAENVQAPVSKGEEAAADGELSSTVRMGSFGIGTLLIAAGLLKLKQAADTQGQKVKYGDGLWRLFVGACLASVPAVYAASTAVPTMTGVNPLVLH